MAADEPLLNFLTSLSVCLWNSHAFVREAQSRRHEEKRSDGLLSEARAWLQ